MSGNKKNSNNLAENICTCLHHEFSGKHKGSSACPEPLFAILINCNVATIDLPYKVQKICKNRASLLLPCKMPFRALPVSVKEYLHAVARHRTLCLCPKTTRSGPPVSMMVSGVCAFCTLCGPHFLGRGQSPVRLGELPPLTLTHF